VGRPGSSPLASLVFGPVPSRRLGRSLGVNTIPHKVCSYSCAYCQVGRTTRYSVDREAFVDPDEVFEAARARLRELHRRRERVDYLAVVPDGEPTLDRGLGRCIHLLKTLGTPVAVITNASLLQRADVRADLAAADWVSVKVDAVREGAWRRLNRPHRRLVLVDILDGMRRFRAAFTGRLVTETMLVNGANDGAEELDGLAAFLARLAPAMAYLAVPTRPPADARLRPASATSLTRAHELVRACGQSVELLTGSEGEAFSTSGDPVADLLAITAVHPMRRAAVEALLARTNAGWQVVRDLVANGQLTETPFDGDVFFLRDFTLRYPRRRRREGRQAHQGG
jgi:wyosine [tRNA(Phe)-imidazoG37] synthetase (radical SAM superfamily)